MKKTRIIIGLLSLLLLGIIALPASAADKVDCTMCHPEKSQGRTVHPAVSYGCDACHTGVDASDIPHKFTGEKGLSQKGNDLCLTCHDAGKFTKETVHPALDMGCTSCHSPHSTDLKKLLVAKTPDLCYLCHNETLFFGPTIHAPVAQGECVNCHTPHSSDSDTLTNEPTEKLCFTCHVDYAEKGKGTTHKPVMEGQCLECHLPHISNNEKLLFRKGNLICRKCHADKEKNPHTVAGFSSPGHPVSGRRDLGRPGKIHSCQSCHLPHKSDYPYLFRYRGNSAFDLCGNCHKSQY